MNENDNSLLSLQKARELFIKSLENNNRSSNTIIAYDGDLSQLENFLLEQGVGNISEVEADHLEQFKKRLQDEKYTAKSISRKLNSIKSFFKFLSQEGVIAKDPAREVSHPKIETSEPRFLKPLEYRALRDVCRSDPRTLAIIELILQAGLRISEVANLRLVDIQDNAVVIRAQESHSERKVPINPAAKAALNDYLLSRPEVKIDYLFVTKTGRPLLVRNIRSSINRAFQKAGIEDAKVNDLRNTFIVQQLEAGVPLEVVSRIVGHKRISTTEKYLQMVNKQKESTRGFRLVEL